MYGGKHLLPKVLPNRHVYDATTKGCFPDLNFRRMQTCSVYLVSGPFLCQGSSDAYKACTKTKLARPVAGKRFPSRMTLYFRFLTTYYFENAHDRD